MKQGWNSIVYLTTLALVSLTGACGHFTSLEVNPADETDVPGPPSGQTETPAPSPSSEQADTAAPQVTLSRQTATSQTETSPGQGMQLVLDMGTGNYVAEPKQDAEAQTKPVAGDITLNFQDTDLREFIKVILGDILNTNYVIDSKVGGKVTVETADPVTRDDLLPLFEEILAMNGATIVKSDSLYKILPINQTVRGNLSPTIIQQGKAEGYSVRVIPLQYVAAREMQKILEPFLKESGNLRTDVKRNLLIISGTRQEQDLIRDTIDIFDVDWMRGMSMGLYPLDYVDPKTLKDELDAIIGAIESESSQELLGGMVRIVAIERLNSILLISSTPAALKEVQIWLNRLDRPGEHVGKRLFVYNVQNAKAVDLAAILGPVFGGTADAATRQRAVALAPGLTPAEISSAGGKPPKTAATGEGVVLPSGDTIQIIADDVRNALVVLATPQDYKMVEAAILKLDVVPLQVLIEASILEVTLRDDLSYGVEWFFNNRLDINQGKKGIATLDLGSEGIAGQVPAFSYVIRDAAGVNFALNALENESQIDVLSSPSLMVLDNQTATINVGDEIPVPSRQSISNLDPSAPTVNEIQYRKTGVTLTVTPRVNSGGLVTMEIVQEVSSAVTTTTSDIDAPTIQNRLIESVVAVNSGETIVLGGLIQDNETTSKSGIPGLYKLPLIGNLFGRNVNETLRTELLILITPRVVGSRDEARDITNEFRNKLRRITPLEIKRRGDRG